MTQVLIDNKKYVILPVKEYKILQKKAALKSKPEQLFSLEEARAYSKKR
jgi:PHD/YefM family antitoxin component YafN of YafNO toxin-antitoxin module